MNKLLSLFTTILCAFHVQSLLAEEASTPAVAFDYSFQPLSWYPLEALNAKEKEALPSFCSGKYRPVALTPKTNDNIEIEADESTVTKKGDALLLGNVEFSQLDRKIFSDQAVWSYKDRSAEFTGNVTIINPSLVMSGDYARVNENDKIGHLENSEYSIPSSHMRGTAKSIDSFGQSLIKLNDSTYTFCEPGSNDWDIKASEITLDKENGVGSAWHTLLRVKEVPVLYLPYYRFPIDDRRMTGFLDPTFSINGQAQASEIATPFYINLHPQADATITPKEILDHGLLWQGQFRHLTSIFGYGELNYAELNDDRSYLQDETTVDAITGNTVPANTPKQDRWSRNYSQFGDITNNWKHRWEYNRVSDNEYFSDMNPTTGINRATHLPTFGEIYFNQDAWHFDVLGESYQTIDDTIAEASRPYKRVPQLNFTYKPETITGLGGSFISQATQFERDNHHDTLTGIDAVNGTRLVLDGSLHYTFDWPFAYITPKAEYKIRQYQLTNVDQTLNDQDYDKNPFLAVPKYSLDAGLFFERPVDFFGSSLTQTLEPRVFHLQVPYYDQSDLPNFDTSAVTFNYSQLFRDYRFNGNDRIADANQTTLGVTTRFLNDSDGSENFNASIGQIFYHDNRKVQLTGSEVSEFNQRNTSSTVIESTWNLYEDWRLYSMLEWGKPIEVEGESSKDQILQKQFSIEYNDDMNHMANIGLRENQAEQIRQFSVGFFWALNDSWALVGSRKKDLWNYSADEVKPVDAVIDALVGFEYQACCWSAQLLYQEQTKRITSVDPVTGLNTDKTYGFLLRIELKGLSAFGADPSDILSESIRGYSSRRYFDFESE